MRAPEPDALHQMSKKSILAALGAWWVAEWIRANDRVWLRLCEQWIHECHERERAFGVCGRFEVGNLHEPGLNAAL